MEQANKRLSVSFNNKNSRKGDIRTDIKHFSNQCWCKFLHIWRKQRNTYNSHPLVLVKTNYVKSDSRLFEILREKIGRIMRKLRHNIYMIKSKLDGISWIETNNKNWKYITKENFTGYTVGFVIIFRLSINLWQFTILISKIIKKVKL